MNGIMKHRRLALVAATVALGALALAGCSSTNAGGGETGGNNLEGDIAAGSVGTVDQFADIADLCPADAEDGSITLGVVDGGGTNSWSKTVLAEIESEAAKCAGVREGGVRRGQLEPRDDDGGHHEPGREGHRHHPGHPRRRPR